MAHLKIASGPSNRTQAGLAEATIRSAALVSLTTVAFFASALPVEHVDKAVSTKVAAACSGRTSRRVVVQKRVPPRRARAERLPKAGHGPGGATQAGAQQVQPSAVQQRRNKLRLVGSLRRVLLRSDHPPQQRRRA